MSTEFVLNKRQYLELEKIGFGVFAPLSGFMGEADFKSVVRDMRLASGEVFPLPVVLDVTASIARTLSEGDDLELIYKNMTVGSMRVSSIFSCDKENVSALVYGTTDRLHPGVDHLNRMGSHFVGGPISLAVKSPLEFTGRELTPSQTRKIFAERGWKTVAGFQTRNVPHRAHEYLLRIALEVMDGVFIHPLVGFKRRGDYQPAAILAGYDALIGCCFPPDRVLLGVLSTSMRYAGPREAVFHAIVRRNYGCTHFIVGRDHAGVGGFYEKYEAQSLSRKFESEIGIKILPLSGPFYCYRCGGIATERTCRHAMDNPEATHEISGTDMRKLLCGSGKPAPEMMRTEVIDSLGDVPVFIQEDE